MSRSIPAAAGPDRAEALASAVRKIKWHVLPLFVVMFIVNYIDRVNIGFVRQHLSQHEYPRQVAFVRELPKTPAGKVNRKVLREREAARETVR